MRLTDFQALDPKTKVLILEGFSLLYQALQSIYDMMKPPQKIDLIVVFGFARAELLFWNIMTEKALILVLHLAW